MLDILKQLDHLASAAIATYPSEEVLELEGLSIRVIRTQRKSVSLQVKPKGIVLRAPLTVSTNELKQFALSKQTWLKKRHAEMQAQIENANKHYIDGETFLFLGAAYTLKTISGNKSSLTFNHHTKTITAVLSKSIKQADAYIKRKLNTAYKAEAFDYLNKRCSELSNETGLKYKSLKVRDYKARWGSCSNIGDLTFNWRIIMAPTASVDAVIIHELAHTKHFNHSKRFWALVHKHYPNYANAHKYFQENQYRLMT